MGKCSLTAAIPVISVMGVQACPLPTAVLSNQTGYDSYFCDDYTDRMNSIMKEWQKRRFQPDGIYTGYLAGEKQADIILDFIHIFAAEDTFILVDPVLGDRGMVYDMYTEALCEKMRLLAAKAQVITPNLTEALLLLEGKEGMQKEWDRLMKCPAEKYKKKIEEIAQELAKKFQMKQLVITGVDGKEDIPSSQIGNLAVENDSLRWILSEKHGGSYSGTGDLFASVLSAGLVKGMSMTACVEKAVRFLSKAIADTVKEGTDRNDGVCFETYLYELVEVVK